MNEKYPGSNIEDATSLVAINLDGEHIPEPVVKKEASSFDPNNWTEEIAAAREVAQHILGLE